VISKYLVKRAIVRHERNNPEYPKKEMRPIQSDNL
jgi:hypothetical protein